MQIIKEKNGNEITVKIIGRLDTVTGPELEKELQDLTDINKLILDFTKLDYISSAGLRILLTAHKQMSKQGEMVVLHPIESVMEIFEVTGFDDILTIEH